jgi:hypothetical protein
MGLQQIGEEAPNRLFIVNHQNVAIIEQGLMSGLV